jgi:hypothetical protein
MKQNLCREMVSGLFIIKSNVVKRKLVAFFFTFFTFTITSQTIPINYFGINGWMPDSIGPNFINGHVKPTQLCSWPYYANPVSQLETRIMRYGGANQDFTLSTISQLTNFAQMARNNGMEPLIQIPFYYSLYNVYNASNTMSLNIQNALTATGYAATVQNIVQVMMASPYKVRYFSISNEPDNWSAGPGSIPNVTTPSIIAMYFRQISEWIKSVNPDAIVVGPDLSQSYTYNNGLMWDFIGGNGNGNTDLTITSTVTPFKPYCDVFAYHTYPYGASHDST